MIQGPFENGYKRLSPVLRACRNGQAMHFWCPACDEDHMVIVQGPESWGWNGDVNKPTLRHSVLISGGKVTTKNEEGRWNGGWVNQENGGIDHRCHSQVTDGKIFYYDDCSHDFKGQTLELVPWYTHETTGLAGRSPADKPQYKTNTELAAQRGS